MIKLNTVILVLILVCSFTACEKNDIDGSTNDIAYVKYGTSFGECVGYCRNDITVTYSKIDYNKSGWDIEGSLPEISATQPIDLKYVTALIDKINFDSFLELDAIIGCPDCADGGAEWIEIKSRGISHKVIFEYGNEPSEMKEYVGFLRTYIKTFQIDANETVDFNERTIINQEGFIKNFVATRGSYQWLIGIIYENDTTYYFDKYLDTKYQQDNLKIEFKGVLDFDSTMIYKPAPNDISMPDFKAQNIRTFDIHPIDD